MATGQGAATAAVGKRRLGMAAAAAACRDLWWQFGMFGFMDVQYPRA